MSLLNQSFPTFQTWVSKASSWLTNHDRYDGKQFRAICFDAKGRLCICGADFMRADKDGAFPVRWLWPDQVGEVALGISSPLETDAAHFAAVDHANAGVRAMGGFSIQHVHDDYYAVIKGGVKVGIVFPARGDQALSLYPNPAVFPDLAFTGLPAPMRPEFMTFPDMDALKAFLGIQELEVAA